MRTLLLTLALGLPLSCLAADRVTGAPFATRSEVYAPHAMAATSHPLATQIALDVMRNGGSAVDAAIAANAALGLMEPTGSGPCGGMSTRPRFRNSSRVRDFGERPEPL